MKSYLAAVHYIQIAQGFGDPQVGDMSHLEHVVKGLKKAAQVKTVRLAYQLLQWFSVDWKKYGKKAK